MSTTELKQLYTFKEAMCYLRVSRSKLVRMIATGQVRGHKVGKTWRFYEHDLCQAVRNVPVTEQGEQS